MSNPIPESKELFWRLFSVPNLSGGGALVAVLFYLWPIIRFTPGQTHSLLVTIALVGIPVTVTVYSVYYRNARTIMNYLDAKRAGNQTYEQARECFRSAISYPRTVFLTGVISWTVGGFLIAVTWGQYADASRIAMVSIVTATLAAGFLSQLFSYLLLRRRLEPVLAVVADEFEDPLQRGEFVPETTFGNKLTVVMVGMTLMALVFGTTLMQARSTYLMEGKATAFQLESLDRIVGQIESGRELDELLRESEALLPDDFMRFIVVSEQDLEATGGLDPFLEIEMDLIRENPELGETLRFDLPHVFSWKGLPENGAVLVVYSPFVADTYAVGGAVGWGIIGLIAMSVLAGLAIARFAARDFSEATQRIGEELMKIRSGDLSRRGVIYESEDELGHLGRAIQALRYSLRGTVSSMSEAADQMEATVSEVSGVGNQIAGISIEQIRGVEAMNTSMEEISADVERIASSTTELSSSVDESSSTLIEMRTVGDELSERASVLFSKAEETSGSIEEMISNVAQVSQNSEDLNTAAQDATQSMAGMEDSVRTVGDHARETAELSERVVLAADQGRERVRATMEGMETIRASSEAAEEVISKLGERTAQIGSIINVIDNVADETNLLALNAAIIAAQAGDHGRAFSVVADEIKDLADRVIGSTKEIDQVVTSLQSEGQKAVGVIKGGAEGVRNGVELSRGAGESLEAITEAARQSGERVAGIVDLMQRQIEATHHVVDLMDNVGQGVERIRHACEEQSLGSRFILESAQSVQDIVGIVDRITKEQARGGQQVVQTMEHIRDAMQHVNELLGTQSEACYSVAASAGDMHLQAGESQQAAERMREVMEGLQNQAEVLRDQVRQFKL